MCVVIVLELQISLDRVRRYQDVVSPSTPTLSYRAAGFFKEGDAVYWVLPSQSLLDVALRLSKDGSIPQEQKQHPAVYHVTEMPYETVMLVMLNHFIGRLSGGNAVCYLDIAASRDGFHISGWPDFGAVDYKPLVGHPPDVPPNQYANFVQSLLVDTDTARVHWCEGVVNQCWQGSFRRDGFASVASNPGQTGVLVTRPLLLEWPALCAELHVNVACSADGIVNVQVLDGQGVRRVDADIQGINSTDAQLQFTADSACAQCTGHMACKFPSPFRLQFDISDCRVYSFWFMATQTGHT